MNIQFLQRGLSTTEGLQVATHVAEALIRYHESKIEKDLNEEDIKHREAGIIQLQNQLHQLKKKAAEQNLTMEVATTINIFTHAN